MKFKETSLQKTIKEIYSSPQYCFDRNYIIWVAKTTPWRGRRVVRICSNYFNKNSKILDIGSSQALTLSYLVQAFPRVIGIDVDKQAIKTGQERLKSLALKTKFLFYDGMKLPFGDNTFDGVVSTEVFEHVENRDVFSREINRILKPGGRVIISAPNKFYPIDCEFHLPFLSYLPKRIADFYVRTSGRGHSYDHISHPTYKMFRQTLGRYFEIEDITFQIIKSYKKYYLNQERGKIIPLIAFVLLICEKLDYTLLQYLSYIIRVLIRNLSAGWFLVGTKKI